MNVIGAAVFFTLFSIFVMEVILGFVELREKKIGTSIRGKRFVCEVVLNSMTNIDFLIFISPSLVLYPSISVCLQPKEEMMGARIVSPEASERFREAVTFPNHPLVEATISTWDEELAKAEDRYGNGIRKLNFRQEDITGNETLESIIDTWVAFGANPSDMTDTVAWQCVTVEPPTLSKPGISYQVV